MRESVDSLIQKMLSARARRDSEPCANENLMAAYLEASLSPQEMTEFESHVSECATCQEVMALAMKLRPEGSNMSGIAPAGSKRTLFRFSIPIPVLGALLIGAVFIAVFFRFANHSGEKPQATSIAELRQAVQKTEESHQLKAQIAEPHPPAQPMKAAVRNAPAASAIPKPFESSAPARDVLYKDKQSSELVQAENKTGFEVNDEKGEAPAPMRDDMLQPPPAPASAAVPKLELQQSLPADTASQTAGNAFVPPVVQETVSRPKIYAVQNRIATAHYTEMPPMASLGAAIKALSLPVNIKAAKSRKIGDRTFLRVSGPWVDQQCVAYPQAQVIEIAPEAPEYELILKRYPDIRSILPAAIYWEGKNYFLQK